MFCPNGFVRFMPMAEDVDVRLRAGQLIINAVVYHCHGNRAAGHDASPVNREMTVYCECNSCVK